MDTLFVQPSIWRSVLSLLLSALVVMGSPGPSTMSLTATGAAFGLRRSLAYLAGLIAGTTAVLFAVAAGLVSILLSQPRLGPVLLGLSVVYMVYLAYRIATAPPLAKSSRQTPAPGFTGGFLLALANPKAYLAIAAVFTGSTIAIGSPLDETVIKTAVLTGMIILIHVGWLIAGSSLARLLQQPTASRIMNLAFATLLLATTFMAMLE